MVRARLPAELLIRVLDLATDEDVILQYALPTCMAESAWFTNIFGDYALRTPSEAVNLIQRRSYTTKKAIISTCKTWRGLGQEFLFRSLFFDSPSRLLKATKLLVASAKSHGKSSSKSAPPLGWWTRRIHLTRYYTPGDDNPDNSINMEEALTSLLNCCPNLEIFLVDYPLSSSFGPVASVLCTATSRTLRSIHWSLPSSQLKRVIGALKILPNVICAQLDFSPPVLASPSDEEDPLQLGSEYNLDLSLPRIQQLSLKGLVEEFLEQAVGWKLPSLQCFSMEVMGQNSVTSIVMAFLRQHGLGLTLLDLNLFEPVDIYQVFGLCPSLISVAFSADWQPVTNPATTTSIFSGGPVLAEIPNKNLEFVGLHGLSHAFGVGFGVALSAVDPIQSGLTQRHNEGLIMSLAKSKSSGVFPRLRSVRALSRSLLNALERNDGPQEGDGMERWNRWFSSLESAGVRLEDCTGALLGTLPGADEADETFDEDESYDEVTDLASRDDWKFTVPPGGGSKINGLRQLVEECRLMAADREDGPFSEQAAIWNGESGADGFVLNVSPPEN